ncbi:kinase-like protein [Gloeopeniophorella convolvens]|nr:kinase-like protein [Gloeopeniophorella convolvens]
MATLKGFSQHSSNPLELPSSDAHNRAALSKYRKARAMAGNQRDSDDPEDELEVFGLKDYQNHVAGLLQRPSPQAQYMMRGNPEPVALIDLDEDMDNDASDEEQGSDGSEMESDLDADAEGEVDEEMSVYLKPKEEQEEIATEIADLEDAVPAITEDYRLVDRLGTGTFSSVYKALDLGYYSKWDNAVWHGRHPRGSSAHYQSAPRVPSAKVFVAVKRIYVTSNPERIRNEIAILETCRGARHVSQLITAFRHEDQVVVVMPYHAHEDFRTFYHTLSMGGIKAYFRCMFRALRDIHSRGIIHRDVKPANFLFDPIGRMGGETRPHHGQCLHTSTSREYPHGRLRRTSEYNADVLRKKQKEARMRSGWTSDRVGYLEKDTRPHSKANRAGTRGFRAPEVLLKCNEQTGAIDMWSAGMILLFFLTGKFPLFQSNDDVEALLEIACIIGRRKMEKAATLHCRTFTSNLPSITPEGQSWSEFVEALNPRLREPPKTDARYYPHGTSEASSTSGPGHHPPPPSSSSPGPATTSRSAHSASSPVAEVQEHTADVEQALDLLERLLHPESTRRITPRGALYHPFLHEGGAGDDAFFPHHDVTDEMRVRVRTEDGGTTVVPVMAGEGVAIGNDPCEFHHYDDLFRPSVDEKGM